MDLVGGMEIGDTEDGATVTVNTDAGDMVMATTDDADMSADVTAPADVGMVAGNRGQTRTTAEGRPSRHSGRLERTPQRPRRSKLRKLPKDRRPPELSGVEEAFGHVHLRVAVESRRWQHEL